MPQGPRNALLAAILKDPEYWRAFMDRAQEPTFRGGPAFGALVPGLGTYIMTTDAKNALSRGDYEAATGHAIDAATQLIPAGAVRRLVPFKEGGPLLPTPGVTTTATETPEQRVRREQAWADWRYRNPALTPEYWNALEPDWWKPAPMRKKGGK